MLNDLLYRLRALFRRDAMEAELEDELQFHFEREIEKHRRAGMTEQEARRRARLSIGGHDQVKEDCRDARGTIFIEQSIQDARYALRQLWANPTFALVMILTLALSIGANSAIFSVVESVLIRSLPFEQPDRIVRLFMSEPMYPRFPLNPFDFRDFRSRSRSFAGLAGFTRDDLQLSGGSGQPEQLHGFDITAGYFQVLGLHPELGHEFTERNEVPNSGRQVIISDRLWRTRFGADPAILGRKLTLNAMPFTVIGVMPSGTEHPGNERQPVAYGESVDAWTPFWFQGDPSNRGSHFLEGIGRLKDGVTAAQAKAELSAIMAQMARDHGDSNWQVLAVPLEQEIVGASRQMLLVLLGAVGMVLLIACANAANLLLARAASRQRELAVRLALGAPRSRLIRQLLTESLMIALTGGVLGLVLAAGGVRAMVSLLPNDFPRVHDIHLSVPVFAFTMLISLSTGILFGLVPAIQASQTDPKNGLHEGGRSATASGRQSRLRNALVISEVTLACVLLIGAGLMLRSLLNLLHLDPGFRQDHVLTASLSLPHAEYRDKTSVERFFSQLTSDLQSMPEVEAVGAGSDLPWTGWDENTSFNIEGKQPPPKEFFHGRYHAATPDYFRALGTPLVSGRFFTDADKDGAPAVVLVNQAMAEKYWPHENVVGKRITFEDKPAEKDWLMIVGVVADVKDKPNSAEAAPGFWWPHLQAQFHNMSLVVRSSGNPQTTMDAMRNEIHRLNPGLAVSHPEMMNEIVQQSVATPRVAFILVGLFAALAILLAAIGTYGVIAYAVSQRTSEFGLRLALGARRFDLLRLVLAQGARLAIFGTVLGVLMSLGLGRVMRSLIYGVSPADPLIFVSVAFMVLAIAFLASYMPARRAAQADPMTALRSE
ncbi:putative permease [Silvibacterium bohemicum]|uniref:Putative permease n=1 Tax=Silvibacterium bohemicum TaxID=1577686 RepID=A0A841K1Y9_9BACT|nr:ABC transporter permease [Silvibacterium bohemicum]MBB6147420.1 putative permease [Silvibacterium bohemicum]